jgi:hypothetical protein
MARAGGAYVVRDEQPGAGQGSVDRLFPYTLKGLTDALDEARFRSHHGPPQVVAVLGEEAGVRIIRRYADGREVPPAT